MTQQTLFTSTRLCYEVVRPAGDQSHFVSRIVPYPARSRSPVSGRLLYYAISQVWYLGQMKNHFAQDLWVLGRRFRGDNPLVGNSLREVLRLRDEFHPWLFSFLFFQKFKRQMVAKGRVE